MQIQLNPQLDRRAIQAAYKRHNRIHVPNVLSPDSAAALHELFSKTLTYDLVFTQGDGLLHKVQADHWRAHPEGARQKFIEDMAYRATGAFRYFYGQFDFELHLGAEGDNGDLSRAIWNYFNASEFLTLVSELTGDNDLRGAHLQASRYEPGHFLSVHDDTRESAGRRIAFVLNLSPAWQVDWGGLLQFIGPDGHVLEAFTPTFNALSLFKVPMLHSVSMVTPLTQQPRYAITGWALDRPWKT